MRSIPLVLAIAACTAPDDTGGPLAPEWDPLPDLPACASNEAAPLLDAVLADAGVARAEVGYDPDEHHLATYASVLDDAFLLPWFRDLQADAIEVPCFAAEQTAAVDHYAALDHPATGAMWTAMDLLGEAHPPAPIDPAEYPTLATGMEALLAATRDSALRWDPTAVPLQLGRALGPVFGAMAEVIDAWDAMAVTTTEPLDNLARYGHGGVMPDVRRSVDLGSSSDQEWVVSDGGPRALYGPTLRLLHALETADLPSFEGLGDDGVVVSWHTNLGEIRIAGPGADEPGEIDPVLFYLDLGGDDVYVHAAGANANGSPLSVMLDLGGDDTYGYVEEPSSRDGGRLPSDADGRYQGDANLGQISLSRIGRQGAGRFGVGILADFGGGNDTYQSLRMSQGWGHLGVGVLHDDGGGDAYAGECGVQGAASMGIGLLVDGGGDDEYRTYTDSQGFSFVRGVGILADRGEGDDVYWADPGKEEHGGDLLYPSAQLPGVANSSFVQGAGFGRRGDFDGGFLSGGVGLLSDGGGDDVYTAAVFAQGTGYWQGLGVLADAGGDDTYDAYWYVQGGAAHYAIGALLDGGGNDAVQTRFDPYNVHLGSGHDYSIGLFVDEAGDDLYRVTSLGAGASNCQGIGLFADNEGVDVYEVLSTRAVGLGNHSSECDVVPRTQVEAIGLFLDSGGDPDTYEWPDGGDHPVPANDASFGYDWSGHENERGGAVDGDGETGLHF
jgi:hypothetical protein